VQIWCVLLRWISPAIGVGEAYDVGRAPSGQRQLLDRLSVSLIPRTVEELDQLHEKTGMSKTDIVNRAISLYAFVTEQLDSGQDLIIKDRQTGEQQKVQLL
jgi:Ribbon-helix-helix protein, copG family